MFPMAIPVIPPGSKKQSMDSFIFQVFITICCLKLSFTEEFCWGNRPPNPQALGQVLFLEPMFNPDANANNLMLCPPPIPTWLLNEVGSELVLDKPWQDPRTCTNAKSGWASLIAIESCSSSTSQTTAGVNESLVESMSTNIPSDTISKSAEITLEIISSTSPISATSMQGIHETTTYIQSMITVNTNAKISTSSATASISDINVVSTTSSGSFDTLSASTSTLPISTNTLVVNIKTSDGIFMPTGTVPYNAVTEGIHETYAYVQSTITATTNTKTAASSMEASISDILNVAVSLTADTLSVSTSTLKVSTSTLGVEPSHGVDPSFTYMYVESTTNIADDTNTFTMDMISVGTELYSTVVENTTMPTQANVSIKHGAQEQEDKATTTWHTYLMGGSIAVMAVSVTGGVGIGIYKWQKPKTFRKIVPGVDVTDHNYLHNNFVKGIMYTKTDTNKNNLHSKPGKKSPNKQSKTSKMTDDHKMTPVEDFADKVIKEDPEKFIGANGKLDNYSTEQETKKIKKKRLKSDKKADKKLKKKLKEDSKEKAKKKKVPTATLR